MVTLLHVMVATLSELYALNKFIGNVKKKKQGATLDLGYQRKYPDEYLAESSEIRPNIWLYLAEFSAESGQIFGRIAEYSTHSRIFNRLLTLVA